MFGWCIYWFDLVSEIANKFQKVYNEGITDKYLEMSYVSVYSKDPFGDELKSSESMKDQVKLSWVDMVEQALSDMNCSMSKKEIRWILYYYVPEFRMDIARTLKMEIWDTDSSKFILESSTVLDYCKKYFKCTKISYWRYKDVVIGGSSEEFGATAATDSDVETNCKNFFEGYYKKGQNNEENIQTIKKSQLWNDKYWNSSVDDSPYDIMSDFWVIGKLLFEDAQTPLQPVFYHLPIFRNSEKSIQNNKDLSENKIDQSQSSQWGQWSQDFQWWQNWAFWDPNQGNDGSTPTISVTPLPWWERTLTLHEYDRLVEWLWAYNLADNNEIFNGTNCAEEESEPEPMAESDFSRWWWNDVPSQWWIQRTSPSDDSDMSEEDLKVLMDYLQSSVDDYANLPKDKEKEIEERAWDTTRYTSSIKDQMDDTIKEIKNCWDGCKWLRVDQQMSCRIMCACGEIDSPVFDPEKTQGLWPIFKIKFCTVPAENKNFSVWWRRIVSIEEWIKEIDGVVDKLSREWKLWIRTQQYNFLDSTTKKMNIANTFAFSIDVEWVDIANRLPNYSRQYKEYIAKKNNEKWLKLTSIKKPINDPAAIDKYAILANSEYTVNDFSSIINSEINREEKAEMNTEIESLVDPNKDSNASRYASLSNSLDVWISQQLDFWKNATSYTKTFYDYAAVLHSKKDAAKK